MSDVRDLLSDEDPDLTQWWSRLSDEQREAWYGAYLSGVTDALAATLAPDRRQAGARAWVWPSTEPAEWIMTCALRTFIRDRGRAVTVFPDEDWTIKLTKLAIRTRAARPTSSASDYRW